jgi:hypothetical protein
MSTGLIPASQGEGGRNCLVSRDALGVTRA